MSLEVAVCLWARQHGVRIEGGCAMLAGILASAMLSVVQTERAAAHLQYILSQRREIERRHTGHTAFRKRSHGASIVRYKSHWES